jgi:recombinase-like zinc beta ribbon protein
VVVEPIISGAKYPYWAVRGPASDFGGARGIAEALREAPRERIDHPPRGDIGSECDTGSPILLTGVLKCGHCGHSAIALTQQTGKYGRHRVYRYYVCAGDRERGSTVCDVPLRAPLEDLEQATLAEIEAKVLRPEILEAVVERARAHQAQQAARYPDRRAELERQLRGIRQEIDRYVAAIGAGVALDEIKAALTDRKARAERIEAELVGLSPTTPAGDRGLLRRCVEDWRGCLRRGPAVAQQILRKLFPDRIRLELTPELTPEGVRFSGLVMVTQLLAGAGLAVSVVPPG